MLFTFLFGLTALSGAHAQTLPIHAGDHVRAAVGDSTGLGLRWEGTVLATSRRKLLVEPAAARNDTVTIPLDGSAHVQVRRRARRGIWVGGALGSLAGAVPGATAMRGASGDAAAVAFGMLGGLAGAGTGFLTGPVRWEDVRIPPAGFAITPLLRPPPAAHVPFSKAERWREFEPTEANFAEFYAAWRDSLHPIEGVWQLDPSQSMRVREWSGGTPLPRVAIVRDERYDGYDYIGIEVPGRGRSFRSGYHARVLFALRPVGPRAFDVRYTRDGGRRGVNRVELFEDWWLEFQFTGDHSVEVWDKLDVSNR